MKFFDLLLKRRKTETVQRNPQNSECRPIPSSVQKTIAHPYADLAERCAMGDTEAMYRLFLKFRDTKEDHEFYQRAAAMWLVRAAFYGNKNAEQLLEENPEYLKQSFFSREAFVPGKEIHMTCTQKEMFRMGFLKFSSIEMPEEKCNLLTLNKYGIYEISCYLGYSTDSDGFGGEDEYDFWFFDEFFQLLDTLHGWSDRDIRMNEERIRTELEAKRAEKQKERDAYWLLHQDISEQKYNSLAIERQNFYTDGA